jgi:general secretion pathway protein A
MYLDHFGLYTAPFSLVPHLRFLYLSSAFEETTAHLLYGLEGGEDIILITGEIGSGKTLALHNLVSNIKGQYQVVVVNTTQVQFNELMKIILSDLGVKAARNADRADLLTALKQYLIGLSREGKRLLLVIDEAQNLDVLALEGIRLLTNIGPVDEQLVQLILSGQPGLRKTIDMPELAQVRQRIRVHYHLDSLSRHETTAYIVHRLKVAGCSQPIFSPDAITVIHDRSWGIPRLVNTLADKALLAAYVDDSDTVQPQHISDENLVRSPSDDVVLAENAAQSSEVMSFDPLPDEPETSEGKEFRDTTVSTGSSAGADTDNESSINRITSSLRIILIVAVVGLIMFFAVSGLWKRKDYKAVEDVGFVISKQDTTRVLMIEAAESGSLLSATVTNDSIVLATNPSSVDTLRGNLLPVESIDTDVADTMIDNLGYVLDLQGPCIHVASFLSLDRAASMREQLAVVSPRTVIRRVQIGNQFWYRVYSGPWDSVDEALGNEEVIRGADITDWYMLVVLKGSGK